MPGPRYGFTYAEDSRKVHQKCRDGRQCTGPGCKLYTGKTQRKGGRGRRR